MDTDATDTRSDEVAERLRAVVELARGLSEAELLLAHEAVQAALGELAFSHGFTRLARRVAVLKRAAQRAGNAGAERPVNARKYL